MHNRAPGNLSSRERLPLVEKSLWLKAFAGLSPKVSKWKLIASVWLVTGLAAGILICAPGDAQGFLLQNWRQLSPEDKRRALENYELYQGFDHRRKQDVERNYQKWRSLPEPEKKRLRRNFQRYREMSPSERKEFDLKYRKWRHRR